MNIFCKRQKSRIFLKILTDITTNILSAQDGTLSFSPNLLLPIFIQQSDALKNRYQNAFYISNNDKKLAYFETFKKKLNLIVQNYLASSSVTAHSVCAARAQHCLP